MLPLLLENALVIGMTRPDDVTPEGAVLVEEGAVTALHSQARTRAAGLEKSGLRVERRDAAGLWLLPGFVQTHVHLCQTLLRNGPDDRELLPWLKSHVWPGEAALTGETLEVSARLGLAELLAGGTTAILDMGTVRHTDAIFRAAALSGMRVTSGNALMDDPATNPPALCQSADEGLAETERLLARWHGREGGRLRVAFCPRFAVSCTDRCLAEVAARARRHGVLVHTHSSESPGEIALVRERTGRANVRYLADTGLAGENVVLAHVIHTDEGERRLLADTRTAVTHCPTSNLKLASGICPVPEYLAMGIRMGIGADGAPCNDRLDVFSEMRLAALLPKVRLGPAALPAWEVVRMATSGGAEAIGLGGVCGTIAVGKRADLVLLDPEAGFSLPVDWREDPYGPIVYSFDRSQVVATYVDGVLRHDRGSTLVDGLKPQPSEIRQAVARIRERRA
jgi:cytosine/adenosine deaminase-related metal-dependent hydrolase